MDPEDFEAGPPSVKDVLEDLPVREEGLQRGLEEAVEEVLSKVTIGAISCVISSEIKRWLVSGYYFTAD